MKQIYYILLSTIFYTINIESSDHSYQQLKMFRLSASSWIVPLISSSNDLLGKVNNPETTSEVLRKFKADLEIKINRANEALLKVRQHSDNLHESEKNVLSEFAKIVKNAEKLIEEASIKLNKFDQK